MVPVVVVSSLNVAQNQGWLFAVGLVIGSLLLLLGLRYYLHRKGVKGF
jgi:hypothetical protein